MKLTIPAMLALCMLSGPAFAELIQSTTGVNLTFRNCVKGETACDSIGPAQANKYAGLPGDNEARASMDNPGFGKAVGEVKRTDTNGGVAMRANVSTVAGARNGSNNYSLHRYTNNSGHPETLTFNGTLTFEQTVPAQNAVFPEESPARTIIIAEIAIFTLSVEELEAGSTAQDNMAIFQGDVPEDAEYAPLTDAKAQGPVNISGWGEESLTATVTIQPGDSVWFLTVLQGIAANGALVKASLDTTTAIK